MCYRKGDLAQREWNKLLSEAPLKEQNELLDILLHPNFTKIDFPKFSVGEKLATRDTNFQILNSIAKALKRDRRNIHLILSRVKEKRNKITLGGDQ